MLLAGAVQLTPGEVAFVFALIIGVALALSVVAGLPLAVGFARRNPRGRGKLLGLLGYLVGNVIAIACGYVLDALHLGGTALLCALVPATVWAVVLMARPRPTLPAGPTAAPGSPNPPLRPVGPLPSGYQAPLPSGCQSPLSGATAVRPGGRHPDPDLLAHAPVARRRPSPSPRPR